MVADAYRAYAYFRWVDDQLDAGTGTHPERSAFLARQKSILEKCYLGEVIRDASLEEKMLVELDQNDPEHHQGLHSYLHNLMAVMAFDADRKGKRISESNLTQYTHLLASAVTEAMHHFIGHNCPSPQDETRYLAVSGAHITHMLRDTMDDTRAGYFNIPMEVLAANDITPQEYESDAYRAWVRTRVQLARRYFQAGSAYLHHVENLRCRLAGFAYMERFTRLLDTIEQDEFHLRPSYEGPHRAGNGRQMGWHVLASTFGLSRDDLPTQPMDTLFAEDRP